MDEIVFEKLNSVWEAAKQNSPLSQKSAVCISTVDKIGYPHSRFVDLKSVQKEGLIFCTAYDSFKGRNLTENPKISLAAWWDHVGYQIRVVGEAKKISEDLALKYWTERNLEAQVVSSAFKQSNVWCSEKSVELYFNELLSKQQGVPPKPPAWGGYLIRPKEVEFLAFKASRLHIRERFVEDKGAWKMQVLQP